MKLMDENWDKLAEMLRHEIEGYGRLFYLLEEQREKLLSNNLDDLLAINDELNGHTHNLQRMRRERETYVVGMWRESGSESRGTTIKGLLKYAPSNTELLFEELLSEINRLVLESRSRLQQNQMLLRRCREIGHTFLCLINPDEAQKPQVYGYNGNFNKRKVTASAMSYHNHA